MTPPLGPLRHHLDHPNPVDDRGGTVESTPISSRDGSNTPGGPRPGGERERRYMVSA